MANILYITFFQVKLLKLHTQYLAQGRVSMANARCHGGMNSRGFQLKDGLAIRYITLPLSVSPDSSSSKLRAFPHLIVRHDIERVPVQGEGHVPEDGAAILHHGHCLVQHSSLQRTVHSDLQRHRQIQGRKGSECLAAGQQ